MLVDATEQGRQINWKYVIFLILLAGTALLAAFAVRNPLKARLLLPERTLQLEGTWVSADSSPETEAVALGEGFLLRNGKQIDVMTSSLRTVYGLDAEENAVLATGGFSALYVPQARELTILCAESSLTMKVSGGVDAVIVGKTHGAVVTSASGYLTKTTFFSQEGSPDGEILLEDGAMVFGGFFPEDDGFWGISFHRDGIWYLGCCDLTGNEYSKTPIDGEIILGAMAFGATVVLRTQTDLRFYSRRGELLKQVPLYGEEFVFWEADEIFALVTKAQDGYRLKSLSQTGEVLGELFFSQEIRDIEVLKRKILILDHENLKVYDGLCRLESASNHGARAASIAAGKNSILLLGNGEQMQMEP